MQLFVVGCLAALTFIVIAMVCYVLSKGPYNEINFHEADNGPLNATYGPNVFCDEYCPHNYCICCNVCEHRPYCKDVCEDYNGPCDVREVREHGEN